MRNSLVFIALAMLTLFSSCKSKPGQLTLITDANVIFAAYADNGLTTAELTTILTNKDGLAVNSARIDFTCSHGAVTSPVYTDSLGVAKARFTDIGAPSLDQNDNPVPAIITAEYSEDNIKVSTEISILDLQEMEADIKERGYDDRNVQFYDSMQIEQEKSMRDWVEAQKQMELRNYSEAIVYLKKHNEREPRPHNYDFNLGCIAETYAMNNDVDSAFQYLNLYVDALNEVKGRMDNSTGIYRREYSRLSLFGKEVFLIMYEDPRWPILKKRADNVINWIKEYESPENQMKLFEPERKRIDDFVELKVEVNSLEKIGKYDLAIQACKDVQGYKNSYLILGLIARSYCSKGDIEMTFDYLEQAKLIDEGRGQLVRRFIFLNTVKSDPQFRKVASDPRWKMIHRR